MANIQDKEQQLFANIEALTTLLNGMQNEAQEGAAGAGPVNYTELKRISDAIKEAMIQSVAFMNQKVQNMQQELVTMSEEVRNQQQNIQETSPQSGLSETFQQFLTIDQIKRNEEQFAQELGKITVLNGESDEILNR